MESKVERLLRFELFIPHLYHDMDHKIQIRSYVDAADDDWALTVTVQSNDTLQRSKYKPPDSPTSTAFLPPGNTLTSSDATSGHLASAHANGQR